MDAKIKEREAEHGIERFDDGPKTNHVKWGYGVFAIISITIGVLLAIYIMEVRAPEWSPQNSFRVTIRTETWKYHQKDPKKKFKFEIDEIKGVKPKYLLKVNNDPTVYELPSDKELKLDFDITDIYISLKDNPRLKEATGTYTEWMP